MENGTYIIIEILFRHKEEQSYTICRKMDGPGDHHVTQKKPD
jgi:hypothetical protein